MEVRINSTLTPEDEAHVAPVIVRAISEVLDVLPIAYQVRVEANGRIFEGHSSESSLDSFPSRATPAARRRSS